MYTGGIRDDGTARSAEIYMINVVYSIYAMVHVCTVFICNIYKWYKRGPVFVDNLLSPLIIGRLWNLTQPVGTLGFHNVHPRHVSPSRAPRRAPFGHQPAPIRPPYFRRCRGHITGRGHHWQLDPIT